MIKVIENRIFHMQNEKISYIINLLKNDNLGHVYFGNKLGDLSADDIEYMFLNESKSAGTVKYSADIQNFTLHDQYQEVPVYGTSDFKEGVVEVFEADVPLYLDFQYAGHEVKKGKPRNLALPTTFGNETDVETLVIKLIDQENLLQMDVSYSIFAGSSTIARSQKITNLSSKKRELTRFLSGALDMKNQQLEFIHLPGAWLKERHLTRQPLTQGIFSVGSLKGASGHQHNPFVALAEKDVQNDYGIIYGANLVYSGNFLAQAEVDEWDNVRLMSGIHPSNFSWSLTEGASFESPEMILSFTDKGYNGLIQESGSFVEKHIVDPNWYRKERPIVFNNWEATYFEFDHQKLLALASEGKKLGMECFVVDDGWFGKRDCDRISLGDWYEDKRKFPHGIGAFAKDIHDLGMKLGIWFEPEMVSPNSDLYRAHPEWVVRPKNARRISVGRGQYVLDFANPDVVNHIFEQMKRIIAETKLEYIKWDMNRNITEAYSSYLENEGINQTEFFHRYILGVYRLYELILAEFPEVMIEGCAGGGGRFDLGILFYSPQIWPSDDSDAVERLAIQSGTLLAYPLSSFSNHVSAAPNHQVKRNTSLKMRTDVAMFGPLGYELNLFELSETEKAQIKQDIASYKARRNLLTFGTFHQLLTFTEEPNEYSWAVYDRTNNRGIISFYRILAKANGINREYLKLDFVDEEAEYIVNGQQIAGSVLKKFGLRKPYQFNATNGDTAMVTGDFQSYVYQIEKIKTR